MRPSTLEVAFSFLRVFVWPIFFLLSTFGGPFFFYFFAEALFFKKNIYAKAMRMPLLDLHFDQFVLYFHFGRFCT
jgi:hypothetical protein